MSGPIYHFKVQVNTNEDIQRMLLIIEEALEEQAQENDINHQFSPHTQRRCRTLDTIVKLGVFIGQSTYRRAKCNCWKSMQGIPLTGKEIIAGCGDM
jgi:hypothetical protein